MKLERQGPIAERIASAKTEPYLHVRVEAPKGEGVAALEQDQPCRGSCRSGGPACRERDGACSAAQGADGMRAAPHI